MRSVNLLVLGSVLMLCLLLIINPQYGATWDAWEHVITGEVHYTWLMTGVEPTAWHSPNPTSATMYGPFSTTLMALTVHANNSLGGVLPDRTARSLLLIVLLVITGLAAACVVRHDYGLRAALCTQALIYASPHLLGHVHNNLSDFPVTMWMTLTVCALYTGFRNGRLRWVGCAGILAGAALATKLTAVLLAPIILLFALTWCCVVPRQLAFTLHAGIVLTCTAVGSTLLFWPWLWTDTLAHLTMVHAFMQRGAGWNGGILYRGQLHHGRDWLPDYPWVYMLVTTPITWLVCLVLGTLRTMCDMARRRLVFGMLCLFAFLAPLCLEMWSVHYDGVRHFLPAMPWLAVLAALGLDWWCAVLTPRLRWCVVIILYVVLADAITADITLHPYQAVYFNQLVGGTTGAAARFDLDYWGCSVEAGGRWVNEHVPSGAVIEVIPRLAGLAGLRPDIRVVGDPSQHPQYALVLHREALVPNPYARCPVLHEVRAAGAVLTTVYAVPTADPSTAAPGPCH